MKKLGHLRDFNHAAMHGKKDEVTVFVTPIAHEASFADTGMRQRLTQSSRRLDRVTFCEM